MPDVFLLGAGFSVAVHSRMPLTAQLADEVTYYVDNSGDPHIEDLRRLESVLGADVEQWLSFLGGDAPWLGSADRHRNLALFEELVDLIHYVIGDAEASVWATREMDWLSTWFEDLVLYWHRTQSTVITLNYDTLVEREVEHTVTHREAERSRPVRAQMLYCRPIPGAGARFGNSLSADPVGSLTLLKLHGSVNWVRDAGDQAGIGTTYLAPLDEFDPWRTSPPGPRPTSGLDPVIIPPTTSKSAHFLDPLIRAQWQQAAHALGVAKRVFIVGCGLRPADSDLTRLVQMTIAGRPDVQLFTVDPSRIPHERLLSALNVGAVPPVDDARVSDRYAGIDDPILQCVRDLTDFTPEM